MNKESNSKRESPTILAVYITVGIPIVVEIKTGRKTNRNDWRKESYLSSVAASNILFFFKYLFEKREKGQKERNKRMSTTCLSERESSSAEGSWPGSRIAGAEAKKNQNGMKSNILSSLLPFLLLALLPALSLSLIYSAWASQPTSRLMDVRRLVAKASA